MRELFNLGGGHGSGKSMEDFSNLIMQLKDQKADSSNKMGLHEFGYLFPDMANDNASKLPEGADTIAALKKLGSGMADPQPQSRPDSGIPAGYTYLGQFIDHDITRDAQAGNLNDSIKQAHFDPIIPDEASSLVKNVRTASLELDSVYGAGPAEDPDLYEADGVHLKLGKNRSDGQGTPDHIGSSTNNRDIQRLADGTPVLGDDRNDENLLIAQTHHAFKVFHNKVADRLSNFSGKPVEHFNEAQRQVIQHYQWIVLHDFLPRITSTSARDNAINSPALYTDNMPTIMPFEFSVAAYRFGHSMIRQRYEHNSIFGTAITDFSLLFGFTHGGNQQMPVPQSWIINWRNFYDIGDSPANIARPIDTRLSEELERLPNERGLMAMLGTRNLLRGYLMSLPTGQAVAERIGASILTSADMLQNTSVLEREALATASIATRTPLWYYVLKESAVQEGGRRLGQTGSAIVAETLVGLIKRSRHSILQTPGWRPSLGQQSGSFNMSDLLAVCEFEEIVPAFS